MPTFTGSTGTPSSTTAPANRKFETGIPGFDMLSQSASSNISDLLKGVESPAITQNMNAQWGVGAGVPGTDFLRGRATDLYGQRAAGRQQQGLGNLLSMLQGYSGTAVARPGDIMGQETAYRGQDTQANIAANQLAQQASQFGQGLNWDKEQFGQTFPESQRQFDTSTYLQNELGQGQLGLGRDRLAQDYLNSYLSFLQ